MVVRFLIIPFCLLVLCTHVAAAERTLPDRFVNPGATNPDVSQTNIKQTICKANWTKTIRPPTSYTNGLKMQQIGYYGYKDKRLVSYEEDHIISLQLGGHPTDPRNL